MTELPRSTICPYCNTPVKLLAFHEIDVCVANQLARRRGEAR